MMDPVFKEIEATINDKGLTIVGKDTARPWGGFFVIDENDAPQFIDAYFKNIVAAVWSPGRKLSPKILLVAPRKRLSWQYHHRRAEIWKVIGGSVGVSVSDTDVENPVKTLTVGDVITLQQGERHRLVGLDNWAVIAEIWQHTDPLNPSNEEDIVRVQDDFGR